MKSILNPNTKTLNVIGPPPVLLPSNILPPPSSHCTFIPPRKTPALLQLLLLQSFLLFVNFVRFATARLKIA